MDSIDETSHAEVLLLCFHVDIITPQVFHSTNDLIRMIFVEFPQKNNDIIEILFFQIFHIQGRKGSFLYDRLLLPSKSISYSADIVLRL